jgi:hypothetical protein
MVVGNPTAIQGFEFIRCQIGESVHCHGEIAVGRLVMVDNRS